MLADEKVQSFLRQEGYRLPEAGEAPDVGDMLTQLSRTLCCSAEFPHEIGVFLGYPLGDVVGFIEMCIRDRLQLQRPEQLWRKGSHRRIPAAAQQRYLSLVHISCATAPSFTAAACPVHHIALLELCKDFFSRHTAVSYTHLDVYKRQTMPSVTTVICQKLPLLLYPPPMQRLIKATTSCSSDSYIS